MPVNEPYSTMRGSELTGKISTSMAKKYDRKNKFTAALKRVEKEAFDAC